MNEEHFLAIEKKHTTDPLIGLIADVSWAIMNFDKRFSGNANGRTLILSPALSSVYDTRVIRGEFCLGVQSRMFSRMWNIPWKLAIGIRNSPGLYLCFATGAKPPNHYGLLRLYLRPSETKAMLEYPRIKIVRISDQGDDMSWRPDSHFYLPIKKIDKPDWG